MKTFEEGTSIKDKNTYYRNYKQKLEQLIETFQKEKDAENNHFSST